MLLPPRMPNPGEPITASFMRELIRYMIAITPRSGQNVKISQGPNGTTISATASATTKAEGATRGRYAIDTIELTTTNNETKAKITFANCYVRHGGMTLKAEGTQFVENFTGGIVAAELSANGSGAFLAMGKYADLAALNAAERDVSKIVIPLYQFDGNMNLVCDFRIGPECIMGDVIA